VPDLSAEIMPDTGPPWEWYRELAEADEELLTALEVRKPYAYRGTGADVLAGSYGDARLDAPYDF